MTIKIIVKAVVIAILICFFKIKLIKFHMKYIINHKPKKIIMPILMPVYIPDNPNKFLTNNI